MRIRRMKVDDAVPAPEGFDVEVAIAALLGVSDERVSCIDIEDTSIMLALYPVDDFGAESDESGAKASGGAGDAAPPSAAQLLDRLRGALSAAVAEAGGDALPSPLSSVVDPAAGVEVVVEDEEAGDGMTEEAALAMMDAAESPLAVCRRLFFREDAGARDGADRTGEPTLTDERAAALHRDGYVVVDNFVDSEAVASARVAALAMDEAGKLAAGGQAGEDAVARSDVVAFLRPGAVDAGLEAAVAALVELRNELGQRLRLRRAVPEVQLAVYRGGGAHYERHRDAYPEDGAGDDAVAEGGAGADADGGYAAATLSDAMQRRVTCVCYLADPARPYEEADGGQLRVWAPRSGDEDGGEVRTVDVEPVAGRCIIFMSGAVDHQVLPAFNAPRVAITGWYS